MDKAPTRRWWRRLRSGDRAATSAEARTADQLPDDPEALDEAAEARRPHPADPPRP